ncbi:Cupredoxin [Dichotomocladium elegans]|nr:Cupredoxin [Dichotomocladium elegans]
MIHHLFFLTFFVFWIAPIQVEAALRRFELNVGKGSINPDCYNRSYTALFINGQFPAPPIEVTKNDDVLITIRNERTTNDVVTIHFHGILQRGTPDSDGVPGVTQYAIQPGEVYHAQFHIGDQSGTFYYHAHVGVEDDTIVGPFIIYDSIQAWPNQANAGRKLRDGPYEYDDERIIFLNEWWHLPERTRLNYYLGPNYDGMVAADSYLVNGRTVFEPTCANCPGYSVINVKPNTVYRFRVIGALTMAGLGLQIANHQMTIIEVDGILVEPFEVNYLDLPPGQRFSILVKTGNFIDQSFYINTAPYYIVETTGNGRAILQYTATGKGKLTAFNATIPELPIPPRPTSQYVFQQLTPIPQNTVSADGDADFTLIINPNEQELVDGTTRWFINNQTADYVNREPILTQLRSRPRALRASTSNSYDPMLNTYLIKHDQILDVVIHAVVVPVAGGVNACIAHPWHSHGYVHYPIAHGQGQYIHARDKDIRTYPSRPVGKDVTLIFPVPPANIATLPSGTPCGWTKIRIRTDNPGAWALHCHITSHMIQGMMTVLTTGAEYL